MNATVKAAKRQLRKQMHQKLDAIPSAMLQQQTSKVLDQVIGLPTYRSSQHISIYISMDKGELQTTRLLHHALDAGKTVYVPRCNGTIMDMIRLDGRSDLDSLEKNRWGIPEPHPDRPSADPSVLDFVVVPGVAFDRKGSRCGHGKGYYDRFFESAPNAFKCAVCLDEQVIEDVPVDTFDKTPDMIVAAEGVVFEKHSQ